MATEQATSTAHPYAGAQASADLTRIESLLKQLRSDGIIIVALPRVQGYLAAHLDLLDAIAPVCRAARVEFPTPTEIALDLYIDPEIDERYLTLYVRPAEYDDTLVSRIERLAAGQDAILMNKSGRVEVTTDFRSPGGVRGV